jgi:hypothetical protein
MAIQVTNPITVNQESITYDKFWLRSLQITANNPNSSTRLLAHVEKVQTKEDGSFITAPLNVQGTKGTLFIDDLTKEISEDTSLFTFKSLVTGEDISLYTVDIINAVTLKIKQIAEQKGII